MHARTQTIKRGSAEQSGDSVSKACSTTQTMITSPLQSNRETMFFKKCLLQLQNPIWHFAQQMGHNARRKNVQRNPILTYQSAEQSGDSALEGVCATTQASLANPHQSNRESTFKEPFYNSSHPDQHSPKQSGDSVL